MSTTLTKVPAFAIQKYLCHCFIYSDLAMSLVLLWTMVPPHWQGVDSCEYAVSVI